MIRWLRFNVVGLGGILVQLLILMGLQRLGAHYLVAVPMAVEGAIAHNFLWHERWTWKDRPSVEPRERMARLFRFHLGNGLVSLVGNLLIVAILSGFGIPPLASAPIAILLCSLINFLLGNNFVFRSRMNKRDSASVRC